MVGTKENNQAMSSPSSCCSSTNKPRKGKDESNPCPIEQIDGCITKLKNALESQEFEGQKGADSSEVLKIMNTCEKGISTMKRKFSELDKNFRELVELVGRQTGGKAVAIESGNEEIRPSMPLTFQSKGKEAIIESRFEEPAKLVTPLNMAQPMQPAQAALNLASASTLFGPAAASGTTSGCILTLEPPADPRCLLHPVEIIKMMKDTRTHTKYKAMLPDQVLTFCHQAALWVEKRSTHKDLSRDWLTIPTNKQVIRVSGYEFKNVLLKPKEIDATIMTAIVRLLREFDSIMRHCGMAVPIKHYVPPEWVGYISNGRPDDEISQQQFKNGPGLYKLKTCRYLMVPVRLHRALNGGWACYVIDLEMKILLVLDSQLVYYSDPNHFKFHEQAANIVLKEALRCMATDKDKSVLRAQWQIRIQVLDEQKCNSFDSGIWTINCMRWMDEVMNEPGDIDISTIYMDQLSGHQTRMDLAFKLMKIKYNKARLPEEMPQP